MMKLWEVNFYPIVKRHTFYVQLLPFTEFKNIAQEQHGLIDSLGVVLVDSMSLSRRWKD
jgi:hypothetical protein